MSDRYVTQNGAGKKTGVSPKDAAPVGKIGAQISLAGPGGRVLLPDTIITEPMMSIAASGAPGKPVTIMAVNANGQPVPAIYRGNRKWPYSPLPTDTGSPAFRLFDSASHLNFVGFDIANVGDGFLALKGKHEEISVDRLTAKNVRKLINIVDGASLRGFRFAHIDAHGFSKALLSLTNVSDGLIEFVTGDSELQDGDPIAMGVHIEGDSHDVLLRDLFMSRIASTFGGDQTRYWNGDAYSTERTTYGITFERCGGKDSTDSIFDLKCDSADRPHLVKTCSAEDATRSLRCWGFIDIDGFRSTKVRKHGGRNGPANVWVAAASRIRHRGVICDPAVASPFTLDGPATIMAL